MQYSCSIAASIPAQQMRALARYRHEVFVQRLGWKLGDEQGLELDQFDHADTVHLIAQDEQGTIVGCGRLLPTTGAYLLGEVFPELLNGIEVPKSIHIWELSRFASGSRRHAESPAGAKRTAELLLLNALRFCQTRGVRQLLAVTTPAVERIMRRAGVDVQRLGAPVLYEGEHILACVIAVNECSMNNLARCIEAAGSSSSEPSVRPAASACAA